MVRLLSWNTYQATTMPYRHFRRPGLRPALDYFSHHNIDIVCLQEQNSTRFGPVSYCLWSVCLLIPAVLNSFVMELIEYCGVLEGFFLPLFVVDNKSDVIAYASRHTRFKFAVAVPPPRYFFDCGLIILSAHPIDAASSQCIHLRRDAGNRPGLLAVNVTVSPPTASSSSSSRPLRLRVYNVHFVPSLLDVNPVFRVLNFVNARLGRDTRRLRREHFSVLMHEVRRWQEKDPELLTVVAGDLNVSRGSEEERVLTVALQQQAGLSCVSMRPLRATACERTFGHEGQIDYIFVDQRVMQRWREFTGAKTAAPPLRCACSGRTEDDGDAQHAGDGASADTQRCQFRNVEHIWPAHEEGELHSTRVDTMFTSDHYPLMADLAFLHSH